MQIPCSGPEEGFLLRVVIFANGILSDPQSSLAQIRPDDLIIAADGGALHSLALGLRPSIVIGDFDSLDQANLSQMETSGAELIRHPARKNYTDLELALEHARQLGASQILILGALGNRWDQTLANLLLPAAEHFSKLDIRLVDGPQEIFLVRSGQMTEIRGNPGDTLSLIPLYGDATGIITKGLEYVLNDDTLQFGSTRGISNVLLENTAGISCKKGMLVGILIHSSKGTTDGKPDGQNQ
jgi:thiamine pyrophosphokinase